MDVHQRGLRKGPGHVFDEACGHERLAGCDLRLRAVDASASRTGMPKPSRMRSRIGPASLKGIVVELGDYAVDLGECARLAACIAIAATAGVAVA